MEAAEVVVVVVQVLCGHCGHDQSDATDVAKVWRACHRTPTGQPRRRRDLCHRGTEITEGWFVESVKSVGILGAQEPSCSLCLCGKNLCGSAAAGATDLPQISAEMSATGGDRRWGREGARCTRLRFRVASIAARHRQPIRVIRVIRQSAICNLQSAMNRSRWYRSFYWRIGISFLVLVVGVIVVQSVMFSAMMRSASMAPRAPHLRATSIATEIGVGCLERARLRRGGLPAPHPRQRSSADLRRREQRRCQRQHQSAAGRRDPTVGAGDAGGSGSGPHSDAGVRPQLAPSLPPPSWSPASCGQWSSCRRRRWAGFHAKWGGCCRCRARWCSLRRPCWPPGDLPAGAASPYGARRRRAQAGQRRPGRARAGHRRRRDRARRAGLQPHGRRVGGARGRPARSRHAAPADAGRRLATSCARR